MARLICLWQGQAGEGGRKKEGGESGGGGVCVNTRAVDWQKLFGILSICVNRQLGRL